MTGVSTESLKALTEHFHQRHGADANLTMSQELFGAAAAVDRDGALRRALTDPSRDGAVRGRIAQKVFEGKVYPGVRESIARAAASRWSEEGDLAGALEQLGVQAAAAAARTRGGTEALREIISDLLGFTRMVQGNAEVQRALTDPRATTSAKTALVRKIVPTVTPEGRSLIDQAVEHQRGNRRPAEQAEKFAETISALLNRSIAKVTVSRPLDAERARRLEQAVGGLYGKDVTLDVTVDPAILGGMKIQVGNEMIDGSMAARISTLDRAATAS